MIYKVSVAWIAAIYTSNAEFYQSLTKTENDIGNMLEVKLHFLNVYAYDITFNT